MNINKYIRICTPVVGKTLGEFLANLEKVQEISNLVELRVDTIEGLKIGDIRAVRDATKKKSIFTCRSADEGGHFKGEEKERTRIVQRGIDLFEMADIELATVKKYDFSCDEKTKIILSYHNFEETPSYWELQKVVFDMNQYHPDIIKIATIVQKEHEVTKIYRLLTNRPHTEERIVLGMGEKGRMTRILGPLLGSYLTYASTKWGGTAPGQVQLEELQKIYSTMSFKT